MARREKNKKKTGSAGHHRKLGEDFLLQNREKEGILELPTGLQYKVVEEKEGAKPGMFDTVLIHQRALLLDGKLLEDTYRQNKPAEVKMEELIEGLQDGLQMMAVGSRYKFWVPAELAWGKKGTSSKIPPYAVLSFDIRLVDIL